MPYRWIVCPVVTFGEADIPGDSFRCPKIHTIIDPGRGKRYMYSAAIDNANWCLCLVSGVDFTPLDVDPDVFDLFQIGGYQMSADIMGMTLRQLGLNNPRLNRIRTAMTNRGIDTTGLTLDSTVEECLLRICRAVRPEFHPKHLFCREV